MHATQYLASPDGFDPGPAPPLDNITCRACAHARETVAAVLAGVVRGATPEEVLRGDGASVSVAAFRRLPGLERIELLDHAGLILRMHDRSGA